MAWYNANGGGKKSLVLPTNPDIEIKSDDSTLELSWNTPTSEVEIDHYNIYTSLEAPMSLKDMTKVGSVASGGTSNTYTLTDLTNDQTYYVAVESVDVNGYENASIWKIADNVPQIFSYAAARDSYLEVYEGLSLLYKTPISGVAYINPNTSYKAVARKNGISLALQYDMSKGITRINENGKITNYPISSYFPSSYTHGAIVKTNHYFVAVFSAYAYNGGFQQSCIKVACSKDGSTFTNWYSLPNFPTNIVPYIQGVTIYNYNNDEIVVGANINGNYSGAKYNYYKIKCSSDNSITITVIKTVTTNRGEYCLQMVNNELVCFAMDYSNSSYDRYIMTDVLDTRGVTLIGSSNSGEMSHIELFGSEDGYTLYFYDKKDKTFNKFSLSTKTRVILYTCSYEIYNIDYKSSYAYFSTSIGLYKIYTKDMDKDIFTNGYRLISGTVKCISIS